MFGGSSAISGATSLPVTASSQNSASSTSSLAPTANDFIQLLIAEVENQDPTQPQNPTQYITQMASFSELQTLNSIQSELSGSGSLVRASSAYLGHTISAAGSKIAVNNGKSTSIVFTPGAAGSYSAIVTDSQGAQVGQASISVSGGGSAQTFTWQPPSGTPNGVYSVQILAPSGTPVSGLTEQGAVQGVTKSNGSIMLNLGAGLLVPASSVTSVS
jgi:flagellar basal-body rod modification protein FlgD